MQNSRYSNVYMENRGPEVFYGYCHDSRRMRMMDLPDFMDNLQKGYSNLYQGQVGQAPQAASSALGSAPHAYPYQQQPRHQHHGCGCREQDDCSCECCIRCADTVQYAYCGETRKIPLTFDNDSRRERQVNVQISGFATDSGRPLAWKASLSESQFTLAPCSQKTILITVAIDCGQGDPKRDKETAARDKAAATGVATRVDTSSIDSCRVGYAKVSADGCLIRPLIVAVAALPDHCGAPKIGCLCGCC